VGSKEKGAGFGLMSPATRLRWQWPGSR